MNKRLCVGIVCAVAVVVFVTIGRVKTFHCTEMEALVEGWRWWLAVLACAAPIYWLGRK